MSIPKAFKILMQQHYTELPVLTDDRLQRLCDSFSLMDLVTFVSAIFKEEAGRPAGYQLPFELSARYKKIFQSASVVDVLNSPWRKTKRLCVSCP